MQQVRASEADLSDAVLTHAERLIGEHAHTRDEACCVAIINLLSLRLHSFVAGRPRVHLPATLMWLSKMAVNCSRDTHGLGGSEVNRRSVELLLDVCVQNNEQLWTLAEVKQCAAFKAREWQRWQRNPVGRTAGEHLQKLQKLYYHVPNYAAPRLQSPPPPPAVRHPPPQPTPAPPALATPVARATPVTARAPQVASTAGAPEYTGRGSVTAVVNQVRQDSQSPRSEPDAAYGRVQAHPQPPSAEPQEEPGFFRWAVATATSLFRR